MTGPRTSSIPVRLPARTEDVVLHLIGSLSEPLIHAVLDYDAPLDGPRLGRALRLLLDAEPVLGCRFVARHLFPYWQRLAPAELDAAPLLRERRAATGEWEGQARAFMAEPLPGDAGPRLAALWLPGEHGDRLVLKVHHQVADAGATKELAYRLAEIYRALGDDPDHHPLPRLGSRSLRQVFWPLLPGGLPALLRRILHDTWTSAFPLRHLQLPMGGAKVGSPIFQTLHLPAERLALIRATAPDATVNDLVCAAVLRALAACAPWNGRDTLRLWGTVDLRRYLPSRRADGLCNLSGFMYQNLGPHLGESYGDTVQRVKATTDAIKAVMPGLGYPLTSWMIMGPLPFGLLDGIMPLLRRVMLQKMPPVLTNMGAIDGAALALGHPNLRAAHLVVPTSHPPGLILGVSGFRGGLTMSVGHFASALSSAVMAALFARIDRELPGGEG